MAEKQESTLFRKKAMARISSPEDLTSYAYLTTIGYNRNMIRFQK